MQLSSHISVLLLLCVAAASTPSQLSDPTACMQSWTSNLTQFQQALPLTDGGFIPVYSTLTLTTTPASAATVVTFKVTTAVIFVHGLGANANSYFCWAVNSSSAFMGTSVQHILTVAPWFGNQQVQVQDWQPSSTLQTGSLYWTSSSWTRGGAGSVLNSGLPSTLPGQTSYGAMDAIVSTILSKYPSLQLITLAGFSAGAQFVQKYAIMKTSFFSHSILFSHAIPILMAQGTRGPRLGVQTALPPPPVGDLASSSGSS